MTATLLASAFVFMMAHVFFNAVGIRKRSAASGNLADSGAAMLRPYMIQVGSAERNFKKSATSFGEVTATR
jgi:hypothetical protein